MADLSGVLGSISDIAGDGADLISAVDSSTPPSQPTPPVNSVPTSGSSYQPAQKTSMATYLMYGGGAVVVLLVVWMIARK